MKQSVEKTQRKVKGIWIPIEIWETKELTITEKFFLAEVDSLSDNKTGKPCFCGREHFAKLFGVTTRRISNLIYELKSKGRLVGEIGNLRISELLPENGNKEAENQLPENGNHVTGKNEVGYRNSGLPNNSREQSEYSESTAATPPVPPAKIKVPKPKPQKQPEPLGPDEQKLWDGWCQAYAEASDGATYAKVPGNDDRKAMADLMFEKSGKTVPYLILVITSAFKQSSNQKMWRCRNQMGTLRAFARAHQEIIKELVNAGVSFAPKTQPEPTAPEPEPERMDWDEFKALSVDEKVRLVGGHKLKNGEWLMPYEDWKLPLKSAV